MRQELAGAPSRFVGIQRYHTQEAGGMNTTQVRWLELSFPQGAEAAAPKSSLRLAAQSCPTLCDPMDCSPPGSSVHGDSPGKKTAVGCCALLQGIFPTQGSNPGLLLCRQILYCLSLQGSPWVPFYSEISQPPNIHHVTSQFPPRKPLSAHPCLILVPPAQFRWPELCFSASLIWPTESYIQYHTLPKLPFPNILCKVKSSIFSFICREVLSLFGSGSGRWHTFSISSKGDSQEIP